MNQVERKKRRKKAQKWWSQKMQTTLWNVLPKNIPKSKVIRKYFSLTCFTVIRRLLITSAVTCLLNIIYRRCQGSQKIIRCLFFLQCKWFVICAERESFLIMKILLRNSNRNEQLILSLSPARNLTGRIKDGYFKPNEEYKSKKKNMYRLVIPRKKEWYDIHTHRGCPRISLHNVNKQVCLMF